MKTSFHTATLHELPVAEAVRTLLDAGYDNVELNAESLPWAEPHVGPWTDDATRSALRETGAVGSIAAHTAGLASADEDTRRAAVLWTIGCLDLAADVGASVVHVIPGDQPDVGNGLGVATERGDLDAFLRSLREVVAAAEERGLVAALEPIVNQLVSTTDETVHVLEQVPGLAVSFDPSHLQVTTHDVLDAARRLGPYVAVVAVKDAVGDSDDFRFLAQGEGEVPFEEMIALLVAAGFDGPVVVEHEAHLFGDERGPLQVVEESLLGVRALVGS